jgi:hypothetical protein
VGCNRKPKTTKKNRFFGLAPFYSFHVSPFVALRCSCPSLHRFGIPTATTSPLLTCFLSSTPSWIYIRRLYLLLEQLRGSRPPAAPPRTIAPSLYIVSQYASTINTSHLITHRARLPEYEVVLRFGFFLGLFFRV